MSGATKNPASRKSPFINLAKPPPPTYKDGTSRDMDDKSGEPRVALSECEGFMLAALDALKKYPAIPMRMYGKATTSTFPLGTARKIDRQFRGKHGADGAALLALSTLEKRESVTFWFAFIQALDVIKRGVTKSATAAWTGKRLARYTKPDAIPRRMNRGKYEAALAKAKAEKNGAEELSKGDA